MKHLAALIRTILLPLSFSLIVFVSNAQHYVQMAQLIAGDRDQPSSLGFAVATSDNYIVATAPTESGGNGTAYVYYDSGTWQQVAKLYPPVSSSGDAFGWSTSIDGDWLVIGAPHHAFDTNEQNFVSQAGAVFLYKKDLSDDWVFFKKLIAPIRSESASFGYSVDIRGNQIIVGEPGQGNYNGAAYIFEKDQGGIDNWGLVNEVVAPDGLLSSQFGFSVAIQNTTSVIGSVYDPLGPNPLDPQLPGAGSAYVFEKNLTGTWDFVKKIVASARNEGDSFGTSVDISGDNIVVGAPFEDEDELEANTLDGAGSAYLFSRDQGGTGNWGLVKKLVPSQRYQYAFVGASVSIDGTIALAGAPFEETDLKEQNPLSAAGAVHAFRFSGTWSWDKKMVARQRGADNQFGGAVAIGYPDIAIGATGENGGQPSGPVNLGSAYAFLFSSAMPVTLNEFNAALRENQAHLNWSTTDESNSSHFEIQKSADSRSWATIKSIDAAGESKVKIDYSTIDETPLPGDNFYRLKMVDFDGTFAYSKIHWLFFDGVHFAAFYPNPVTDHIELGASTLNNAISVSLINSMGKIVYKTAKPMSIIRTNHFAAGSYILKIEEKNGLVKSQVVAIIR